jgi:chromate reductase
MDPIRVLAFAGSLRHASYNKGLIRAAVSLAPTSMTLEVFDISRIPLYNQDVEDAGEPEAVMTFKQAIAGADALLVATPEYNHGVPGVLKNAIDWASRPRATSPLTDRPVGIMGASTGRGATARAQAQLRDTFVFTGACVMPRPEVLIGGARHLFDESGDLVDQRLRNSVAELLVALHAWTIRLGSRSLAA